MTKTANDLMLEASNYDQAHRGQATSVNQVRFVVPSLPPSMNELYKIVPSRGPKGKIYTRVELSNEARSWKSRAMEHVPRFKVQPGSFVRVDLIYHYPLYYLNGKLRKKDTANLLKLTYDVIAERIGVDDSRFKSGSFDSVDSQSMRVEVTLTELVHVEGRG